MANNTIAILGRPNVGKSTLFNRLVGHRKSIVSSEEGVTRDRIYSKIEWLSKFYNLIDTGGYIPDSKDKIEKQVKFQAEIAREEADLVLFVVDGRNDITSSDRHLAIIALLILACQIFTVATPFCGILLASTNPLLMAKAPTAAVRLPQLPLQSTKGLSMATWPNK